MRIYLQLYNAEADAIGYFIMLDSDNVTADMTYFDFAGFQDTTSSGLRIQRKYHIYVSGARWHRTPNQEVLGSIPA